MFEFNSAVIDNAKREFAQTKSNPFPYTVMDGLLKPDIADQCFQEFQGLDLSKFVSYADPDFEFDKFAVNKRDQFPKTLGNVFEYVHSPEVIAMIENVTGLQGLKVDDGRWGGGLHVIKPGGYLAVHRDFTVLPTTYQDPKQYLRVINLIGYFNQGYDSSWGGELELWNEEGTESRGKVEPKFNRWVLFDTRGTFHGHPFPYKGPRPRYSVAAYYYLEMNVPQEKWKSTQYLKLPWREESSDYAKKRQERANAETRYSNFYKK